MASKTFSACAAKTVCVPTLPCSTNQKQGRRQNGIEGSTLRQREWNLGLFPPSDLRESTMLTVLANYGRALVYSHPHLVSSTSMVSLRSELEFVWFWSGELSLENMWLSYVMSSLMTARVNSLVARSLDCCTPDNPTYVCSFPCILRLPLGPPSSPKDFTYLLDPPTHCVVVCTLGDAS